MNRSPVIGITTDYKEKENTYSKYPWFALRRHYTDCLYKFGCTPIVLPITETVENIDFLECRRPDCRFGFWEIQGSIV